MEARRAETLLRLGLRGRGSVSIAAPSSLEQARDAGPSAHGERHNVICARYRYPEYPCRTCRLITTLRTQHPPFRN